MAELIKVLGYDGTGMCQGSVLGFGSFGFTSRTGSSVAELDFKGKDFGACTNAPCNKRLGQDTGLNGAANFEFIRATDFTKQHHHLDFGISLVT